MIKLSDYIFQYFYNYGIKDAFMLSGGGCMHLVDSLGKSRINYICCLHEQAAAIAALSYSQYNNDLGLCLVTTGPGGTNAVTGVAGAWSDSVPLVILSGQVKTADISGDSGVRMRGFQEIDIVSIVKSITKYAITIKRPEEIRYHLDKAVHLAKTGRPGPVWLDIPLDIQAAIIDENNLQPYLPNDKEDTAYIDKMVGQSLQMISESKRPVILAGHGIRLASACEAFMHLVKKLGIPVLTTWKAADFMDETSPLFFGRPGTSGQRGANFIIQNCDLLISIGARMDFGQIGYEHNSFAREAKKIIVDIDSAELNKFNFQVDLPINLDANQYINRMLNKASPKEGIGNWVTQCRVWKEKYSTVLEGYFHVEKGISTYALVDILGDEMNEEFVFTPCSSGAGAEIPLQSIKIKNGLRVINTPGLGAMGYGLPTALGVAVASGKKVVCINGEGGFQLNIQDLETINRLRLPVKFFILNNNGYGSIMATQRNHFQSHFVGSNAESGVTFPAIRDIAKTYHFRYHKLEKSEEIKKTVKEVLRDEEPAICEVLVDKNEVTKPRVSSRLCEDGKMRSMPLEDLWPFLDRQEFLSNMIVKPYGVKDEK